MGGRTALGLGVVLVLVALAGCGFGGGGTDRVSLSVAVDGTVGTDTYEVTVSSDESTTDHTWSDVTVTGVADEGEVVCRVDFGVVRAGETVTRTVTCDAVPLTFAARSRALDADPTYRKPELVARIGRSSGTDTLLNTESVVLVDVTDGRLVYERPPRLAGGVSEYEVGIYGYSQCRLRAERVDPGVFDRPVPWLKWTVTDVHLNETVITVTRAGADVRRDGRELRRIALPEHNATTVVAAAIRTAAVNESGRSTVSIDLSPARAVALHAALRGETGDVRPRRVRDVATGDPMPRAWDRSTLSLEPTAPCAEYPPAAVRASGQVGADYAVRARGELWEVTVVTDVRLEGTPGLTESEDRAE